MTPRVYRCERCGYHYPAAQMDRYRDVRYSERDRYLCRDEARCQANIARRERDRVFACKDPEGDWIRDQQEQAK